MRRAGDYDPAITELCERALVTIIGNAGFWGRHLYLVGGLVPRYLAAAPFDGGPSHVGSGDVDLAIVLAVTNEGGPVYETLERNLRDAGFRQAPNEGDPDFRWRRDIDGVSVAVEFLGASDEVAPSRSFRPRQGSGSKFQAFNVPGIRCLEADHRLVEIEAERLDSGGRSRVGVRVAGLLPYVALKITAFNDRHYGKDAYDLVFILLNYPGGVEEAGRIMASSAVVDDPFIVGALRLLRDRFADPGNDAPVAYASFLGVTDDPDALARLRNEAVETVRRTMEAFDAARDADA